nr:MAG TPA: hypothetical protein [Bacteriophage sp.]
MNSGIIMVWKDQTQRTWSGLVHIAQLARL